MSIKAKPETPTFSFLLHVSLPISLLKFYKHNGYNVIEQIMTHMIQDNNTTFHYTITGNKDNEKNFLYD